MFGRHYFGGRHFGPRYFGDGGVGAPIAPIEIPVRTWRVQADRFMWVIPTDQFVWTVQPE